MHSSVKMNMPIEFINVVPVNPLISKCQIKVCYVDDKPNRNKSVITKDVARQMANSLPGCPIVGYYNEAKSDFEEHNRIIDISNGKFEIKDTTKPYGFVDLNAKVWFEKFLDDGSVEREYMVTEGYLWTSQYPECKRIIEKGNNQSMELDENTLDATWSKNDNKSPEFFIINEALISKLCILGEDCEPCFEGASITEPVIQFSFDKGIQEQMLSMMNELKDLLSKGGAKVFKRYSVEVGDTLWTALYNHVENAYADYNIESVCENEGTVFAVLKSNDSYHRLAMTIDGDNVTFGAELESIDSYEPEAEPQFAAEAVAEYKKKKDEEKEEDNKDSEKEENSSEEDENGKSESKENEEDKKEEKPSEDSDKSVDEDEDEDKKKKKKYNLEEVTEYVELQTNYNDLSARYNALEEVKTSLENELTSLRAFKLEAERKEKKALIDTFYMLNDEDKEDVVKNIDTYSYDDIESKLCVICVRNKVSFNLDDDKETEGATSYNLNQDNEDDLMPAWVKAALEVSKSMN